MLVAGAGGFIGGHLTDRLRRDGHDVRAVDAVPLERWAQRHDIESIVADLRDADACRAAVAGCDRVYDLACDMGGVGFIASNQVECMLSVTIAANLLAASAHAGVERFFFSSSAAVYPTGLQGSADVTPLREDDALPAEPDGGYGWEKLFTEQLVGAYGRERDLDVRIARYHNVYGTHGPWDGGRERVPAALCRKVATAVLTGARQVEVWGDGQQSRSFLWMDDCVDATVRLVDSAVSQPRNVGSSELVTIHDLLRVVEAIAGVELEREFDLTAPQGVRGRNCDGTLIEAELGWRATTSLHAGMSVLYPWVHDQVARRLSGDG
jgi:nucleoside-diphosphate-sugar epimerase